MVKVTVAMPVSITCNGDVKKPNDVAARQNGLRYPNQLTYFLYYEGILNPDLSLGQVFGLRHKEGA
jgi:hypothetical protein